MSRNPLSARSANCSASASRPVHSRRLASSVCIISPAQRVGAPPGLDLDGDGQLLGLVEPALEVQDVGPQPLGPAHAVGVAELLEALLGLDQLHLGVVEVAGLERRPRPGSGASRRGPARRRSRGRSPSPRRGTCGRRRAIRRRPRRSPGPAGRRRAGGGRRAHGTARSAVAQLAPGRRQVALHLGDRPEPAAGLGLLGPVAVGDGAGQHLLGVGGRLGERCAARARPPTAPAAGCAASTASAWWRSRARLAWRIAVS